LLRAKEPAARAIVCWIGSTKEADMDKKKTLKDEDFPIKTNDERIKTADGEEIATADNEELADDIADRLNDDAWRRHEDNWSA
jgi:hypothetical protein